MYREELFAAIRGGNKEEIKLLLPNIKRIDMFDALMLSLYYDIEIWKILLAKVTSTKTFNCNQLLCYVLDSGKLNKIQPLIKHVTDINSPDNMGDLPLNKLLRFCAIDVELVKLFLEHGANPNLQNKRGNMSLHELGCRSYILITLLLEYGADPNIRNNLGNTSLHMAVRISSFDIITILMKYGADTTIENNNGESPMNIATNKGLKKLIEILEQGSIIEHA